MTNDYLKDRKRVSVRLPDSLLEHIATANPGQTRTHIIIDALFKLLHADQTNKLPPGISELLLKYDQLRGVPKSLVMLRLPTVYLHYINMRQYRLSTCITISLRLYALP